MYCFTSNFKHTHTKYPKWSNEMTELKELTFCCLAFVIAVLSKFVPTPPFKCKSRDLIWALSELMWFRATGT